MLLAVHPLALILASVRPTNTHKAMRIRLTGRSRSGKACAHEVSYRFYLPMESAVTLLFVINVVAFVLATIRPLENTWAFHLVVAPHALVFATIRPVVDTLTNAE